jgi:hypothetical protein
MRNFFKCSATRPDRALARWLSQVEFNLYADVVVRVQHEQPRYDSVVKP